MQTASAISSPTRLNVSAVLWRAVWVGMAAAHAPALLAALADCGESLVGLARLAAWLVVFAFFALKVLDVPWLRLPPSRRAQLGVAVAVVLLHAEVFERTLQVEWNTPQTWQAVLLAGGAASGILILRRELGPRDERAGSLPLAAPRGGFERRSVRERLDPRLLRLLISSQTGERAPPQGGCAL